MTAPTITFDPASLDAFLTSPAFAAVLPVLETETLWHLSSLIPDEEDRRSVASMHEVLRDELGWLYGDPDPSGVRLERIEVPTTSWDDGLWWEPELAELVFSDGTRLEEDLSDLLHDELSSLASNERPVDLDDVFTLAVPVPDAAGTEAGAAGAQVENCQSEGEA
ncbi:hypothetical protein ACIRPK_23890 [Kitasatospora sp. NPDC101801]|uniref:hypothetical protein n=1 Tax=Kitasatospora sp. NPDC101801 TaxID=3364103 RepID=UPI0037F101EF